MQDASAASREQKPEGWEFLPWRCPAFHFIAECFPFCRRTGWTPVARYVPDTLSSAEEFPVFLTEPRKFFESRVFYAESGWYRGSCRPFCLPTEGFFYCHAPLPHLKCKKGSIHNMRETLEKIKGLFLWIYLKDFTLCAFLAGWTAACINEF